MALRSTKKTGKPLVLVLNNVHLFNNDDNGKNMLLQLQQRAEAWAASGEQFRVREIASMSDSVSGRHIDARNDLVRTNFLPLIYTLVSTTFISDDFWPYSVLRKPLRFFACFDLTSCSGNNASRMHVKWRLPLTLVWPLTITDTAGHDCIRPKSRRSTGRL